MAQAKKQSRSIGRSKTWRAGDPPIARARAVSLAARVELPYEPESFTIDRLRDVVMTVKAGRRT